MILVGGGTWVATMCPNRETWWADPIEVCEDELQWDMRVPGKGLLKGVFSFFFFLAFDSSTTCDFC